MIVRSSFFHAAAVFGATLCAAPFSEVQSQQDDGPGAALVAHRLANGTSIQLDGHLDDAGWLEATPVSDFTQQEPVEGGPPSRRTEVRVAYDQDHLYVGAMIFDDPEGILAYQKRRDASLYTDDRFMLILDTFLDGRTGYFFEINAAGLMGDGILGGGGGGGGPGGGGGFGGGGGGLNKSWDGIWDTRVARLADGWSAEIRIPFRTLNFDPGLDTWGINFQRTVRRTNEEILWRGYRRNQGIFRVINAGRLTGLQDMSQGVGLEARPSAVGNWREVADAADRTTFPKDVSLDLSYSITSSLRASLSLNTDFAEVEVDDRRVNLTRFPERFPERRNFFLEGSGVFSFAERNGVSPYFSRRIGLEEGEQIPVRYGARVTGQVGKYELGFIQVGTGSHDYVTEENDVTIDAFVPAEEFTIARLRRAFWSQSTLGAIYTRRSTAPHDGTDVRDRHTAGMDLNLQTANLFGNKNAQFELFWVWNSNPDPTEDLGLGDLTARGLRFDFPNDLWSGHLSFREFGKGYDPEIGFVTRRDFRRVEPQVSWSPRPESIEWLRKLRFSAQFTYQQSLSTGQDEERQWEFTLLDMDFESGDNIQFNSTHLFEYLDEAFEVRKGIEIQPGAFANWAWRLEGRTASRRKVSTNVEFGRSGFWDGTRTSVELGLTVRPNPGLDLSWDWERNHVDLPQGTFNASLYRMSTGWDASPWVSLTGNVQYDNVSDLVGLFTKLRWIVRPGNDVFLVYSHNWERGFTSDLLDRRYTTISRGASVKVNYTYRF
ncbi:MAG TPA: DUF5916 domain-containing protein [Longimicrobiales bacterium]|nr:DUF5916 domain-containing protein [Longimicrobiales bacterium]